MSRTYVRGMVMYSVVKVEAKLSEKKQIHHLLSRVHTTM